MKESEDEAIRQQQEDLTSDIPEEQKQKATAFDLSKVDPEKIRMAEELGIPIGQLISWANSVEVRLNAIQKEMPEQIRGAMTKAIEDAQAKARERVQGTPRQATAGGSQGSEIVNFLKEAIFSGGGGGDEELRNLQKEMYRANIDSIKHRADLSDKVVEAVISKIVAKGVKDIV